MENLFYEEITEPRICKVADIYNHYVLNTTVSLHTEALTVEEMRAAVMHPNPRFKSYVILLDHTLVGYMLIAQHKKKQAYDVSGEVTIYLKPDCVGQGIGRRALQFMEERAKANGFHSLVATVCSENERSKSMFEKSGYTQCAHYKEIGYKFGRWLDILTFQKVIS